MEVQKGVRPHVRFETRSAEDRAASIEAGKKVYKDIDWVIITPPGGKDVVENHAEQWLANIRDRAQVGQYDPEWVEAFSKMYGMYKEGKELPEDGTPLRMCTTLFTPAEIQNCLGANVRTLEMLASANEEALGRIGMGARALKTRAQESIKVGDSAGSAMKVEALQIENAELKSKVSALTEIVTEMREQMALQGDAPRRGRPPKQEAA
jgi:hypothetical protein